MFRKLANDPQVTCIRETDRVSELGTSFRTLQNSQKNQRQKQKKSAF